MLLERAEAAGVLWAGQHPDLLDAIGVRRQQEIEPDLRHLANRERDNMSRQSATGAGDQREHLLAVAGVVQQQHQVSAAGLSVGLRQRAEPVEQRVATGHVEDDRAGWAGARAGALAVADARIDLGVIPHGRDRRRWTHIEAQGAADDAVAAMRAQRRVELEEPRLFEFADHAHEVEQRALQPDRVRRLDADVPVPPLGRGKQGSIARQIEDQVETRGDVLPGRLKAQR